MLSKRVAVKQWCILCLERFCGAYQEIEVAEDDSEFDIIVNHVRNQLLPILKVNSNLSESPINDELPGLLARICCLEAMDTSPKPMTIKKNKATQLKEILQITKSAFDDDTSVETLGRIHKKIAGDFEKLVGIQIESWNDAIRHGIPALAKEEYNNKTMATRQLDLPGKSMYRGSTISTYCLNVFFGIDFSQSPAIIIDRVFSSKITEMKSYLEKSIETLEKQIQQQVLFQSSKSITADGKKVADISHETIYRMKNHIDTLNALIRTNSMIGNQLQDCFSTFRQKSERIWKDCVSLRHWDREMYCRYFPDKEDGFHSFLSIIENAERALAVSQGAHISLSCETSEALTKIYNQLMYLVKQHRKTFAELASSLYNRFVSHNATYIGPTHCIRNSNDYAEDIYIQMGFRFAFSNKVSNNPCSDDTKKRARAKATITNDHQEISEYHGDKESHQSSKGNSSEENDTINEKAYLNFKNIEYEAICEVTDRYGLQYSPTLIPDSSKFYFCLGQVPTMVKSHLCVLHKLSRSGKSAGDYFEDDTDLGGQFITKGHEKLLRNFTSSRTNIPLCLERAHFSKNGKHISKKAVVYHSQMRSGRVVRVFFHYLTNGEILMSVSKKRTYFIPVILIFLCLCDISLYSLQKILHSRAHSSRSISRIETLIKHHGMKPYSSIIGTRAHIVVLGRLFRVIQQEQAISTGFPFLPQFSIDGSENIPQRDDEWYGMYIIRRYVFPHLNADVPFDSDNFMHQLNEEHSRKFELLLHVVIRMYDFVDDLVASDSVDKLSHQCIFTPGKLLVGVVSDAVNRALDIAARESVSAYERKFDIILNSTNTGKVPLPRDVEQYLRHAGSEKIYTEHRNTLPMSKLHRLLTTGGYMIDRELGSPVPQLLGLSLACERLNAFRQIELLRNIHRGKAVAESRSSDIRRCRQESWGFLCVVNTPDGELCGVSQQLSLSARITTTREGMEYLKSGKKSFSSSSGNENWPISWEGMNPIARILIQSVSDYLVNKKVHSHEQLALLPTLCVDGFIAGYIKLCTTVEKLGLVLRELKALQNCPFPFCEVVEQARPFPGTLLVFSLPGNLYRPIQEVNSNRIIMVGPWEQTYLNIASVHSDIAEAADERIRDKLQFSYIEPDPASTLSYTAGTIPFFEYNCSPRNLFVCGIMKQSLGNPNALIKLRCDSKNYLMPSTQGHLVRTDLEKYGTDVKSVNVNAVVAVMSFSGLDMEDAIVMNERCIENGMFDGSILSGRFVRAEQKMRSSILDANESTDMPRTKIVFHNIKFGMSFGEPCTVCYDGVASNGLPLFRRSTQTTFQEPSHFPSTPLYAIAKKILFSDGSVRYVDHKVFTWGEFMENYDESEAGWVHAVTPVTFDGPDPIEIFLVTRRNRNAVIGDKFSSRHGQKGTLSYMMKPQDMPYCMNSGIVPDILINPHAFPSRMTVGMMLEMAAGKLVALSGKYWNASPWGGEVRWNPEVAKCLISAAGDSLPPRNRSNTKQFYETSSTLREPQNSIFSARAIGTELIKHGFEQFSGEEMINGETGELIEGDIFIGICGYQKLRHLVKDKWQTRARTDHVRSRVVKKTGQPQSGKKRHGGGRVGEMERDALLSHGATEVLLDRLLRCSDQTRGYVCKECGGMFTIAEKCATSAGTFKFCYYCALQRNSDDLVTSSNIVLMDMPQALRLLVSEMQSIGVRIAMKF